MANFKNFSKQDNTSAKPMSEDPSLYPYEARIGLACVWISVSILGLVGNSLVIWSVILSKKLRTVTNAFVVNLSVADFWTSLSYPWIAVALVSHDSWPLESEVPCIIAACQLYTGLGASLYTLASIALNRAVLITQPMNTYRVWYSPSKVTVMIAMTWIVSCSLVFIPLILNIGELGFDPESNTCSDIDTNPRGEEYNLIQSLGFYPVPMLIIICCYTALYIHLKRHFRKQKARNTYQESATPADKSIGERSVSLSVITADTSVSSQRELTADRSSKSHRQAINRQQVSITKNLFLVFCIFTLLLSPYYISLAVPSSRKFVLYGVTITIFNSCVNPIIYTINHPQFKIVLRKIIQCRLSEIPEPSDFLKSVLTINRRN
ncbi:melatonin receptor type 1B-A-like [Asterias rubens]|uniref:melatonin receptor type 1B-A-like n=1 Tax=Asterias rubens TaxID=7604 RepID=UPI001455820F|nr:melatonin receptor type 1B-A-like [Asterias rubens]